LAHAKFWPCGRIILSAAEPTLAADIPSPATAPLPPIAPSFSWGGIYGGVQLGGAMDESTWRLFSQSGWGFLYGGQVGFNYQLGQFVLGGEGDLGGSTLKADSFCAGETERIVKLG